MSGTADSTELWRDAFRALTAFALAPERLGGVRLRMPAGPARDAVLQVLRGLLDPSVLVRRLPVAATDETLDGGPDLAASLETGRLVRSRGLLMAEAPLLLIVPMAERLEPRVAGHLVRALDAQAAAPLLIVACDEGREADETPPDALCERLALTLDLTALQQVPARTTLPSQADLALARGRAQALLVSDEMVEAACLAAAALGIPSLRAPAFAIRFAQLIAALEDRPSVLAEDLAFAARFVLGPRTRAVPVPPAQPADSQAEDATEPRNGETHDASPDTQVDTPPAAGGAPEDLVVAAALTSLPGALLEGQARATRTGARGNGKSGSTHVARRRGRPLASRPGRLSEGRLDLLATLKAALPWQNLRARAPATRIAIRRADIHIRRYRERKETLTIFAVDASGSTAAQRLAEAKGAVELLLADCYVRRDQVALVGFRKTEASLILPPTRSLVRAKRLLADMPAGGGTPLAAAIAATADLAQAAARSGVTPLMVFLTDGSANIARDGSADRARAEADARDTARRAAAHGHRALFIDVSTRERAATREIAALLGARHVALPRADARSVARAVGAEPARR